MNFNVSRVFFQLYRGLSVLRWLMLLLPMTLASGAELQRLSIHNPAIALGLHRMERLAASNHLNLAISLPLRNREALINLLRGISDPASPNYRHYLTPEQFTEQFGPTKADYESVIAFAQANGLRVTRTHPNRLLVDVEGPVPQIERALNITMGIYQHPTENRKFYAPDTAPSLLLATPVIRIGGLDNFAVAKPRVIATQIGPAKTAIAPNSGSGQGGTYMGNDFRAAYAPDTTLTGSGQTVGLLQFDGYTASDITYYEGLTGLPNVPLENILIDGASGAPSHTGGEVEVSLDIQMSISMAPGLSKVLLYIAPNPSPFEDILNRMVSDNRAKQLSCSWFIQGGGTNAATDQIFMQMAAQGQSFFNASGDDDAYTGLIDFPGDTPYITQVGGTTLSTTGAGGSWTSETVWNLHNGLGSGGGVSTSYSIPSYQTNISMTANQGSTTRRNTPDVALTANNIYVRANGNNYSIVGTSAAAPLWAGFTALINQQASLGGWPAVGFINPAVTAIGKSTSYASTFHDIKTGDNTSSASPTKFFAVTGYDLCTGWGTPAGQKLVNALAIPEPLVITPTSGFSSIGGVGGPFTVVSENFSLTNIWTNTLTWTLVNTSLWLNASPTGGSLTPGGPATTVTVGLNSIASNLALGTYSATLQFTNLSDGVAQRRQFSLTLIAAPSITLQPTNQTALDGANVGFAAQATGGQPLYFQWQFNSNNLADGGSISGSTTTNLSLATVSTTNAGFYRMVASNIAGIAISTNALLSVPNSAPFIITQPQNQSVYVGATVQFSVSALGDKPFFYQWKFNGTNITGATNAGLTLFNVQFTNAGNYSVTVSNIYGSTLSSNGLLTVNPPPPCLPPPSGLVAWWRAESNTLDSVGTNNGTALGTLGYVNGEVGLGFNYNGADTSISVPASSSLNVGTNQGFTLETWINPVSVSSQAPLFEWRGGGLASIGVHFWMSVGGSGVLYANIVDTGSAGSHTMTTAPNLLQAGVFQHVALTFDKTTGIGKIYYNGSAVLTNSLGTGFTPKTDTILLLGRRMDGGDLFYQGIMDEPSIYTRALTSNEIMAIYNMGSEGKCFTPYPPIITSQPADRTVSVGDTTNFSVSVSGTSPLSYQWSLNGTNLTGATSDSLVLANIQLTNAGNYSITVTNLYGSATSSNALLTVLTHPPLITNQPANQTINIGDTATFAVGVSGTLPLAYQWSWNGTNLSGATNASLILANVQTTNAGNYAVIVTNLYGSATSSNALLTVLTHPPVITTQPTNLTVFIGSIATFSVVASGDSPLIYQWLFNGTNLFGQTNASLALFNVQLTNGGNYSVFITNLYGSVTSSIAVLTVNPIPPCISPSPGLVAWWRAESNTLDSVGTNNGTALGTLGYVNGEVGLGFNYNGADTSISVPASSSLNVGANQGFTLETWINPVSVSSQAPLFEWRGGGVASIGVHFWMSVGGSGALYANIVDTAGVAHTMNGPAGILQPGVFQHVALTFDKTTGIGKIYRNGSAVLTNSLGTGFTPKTDTILLLGRRMDGGNLYFKGIMDEATIYNRALYSNEIMAIYNAGTGGKCLPQVPLILQQPVNFTNLIGGNASFTVVAFGTPPLSYQWKSNGVSLAGMTNATLSFTNIQFANAGPYFVTVTNYFGSTNSAIVTLTVINGLDHFAWNQIPSPRFVNVPFSATIRALDVTNGLYTNFVGTVNLNSTNGINVSPGVSANFVQGLWTGTLLVAQSATGLVLRADSGPVSGLANPIDLVAAPAIQMLPSGGFLLMFWPVSPAGFGLEYATSLAPGNWTNVPSSPLQIGNQYLITIPISGTNAFYRLQFTDPITNNFQLR